jgi:hypothetical protein
MSKTIYDYNLTIMKSPKPATDNRSKWTLCIVTNSELDFLRYCGMWVHNDVPNWFPPLKNFYQSPFSKWSPQSDFNDVSYVGRLWCPELIPNIEKFLPVAIYAMFWLPFWKWQTSWKFWKRRIGPLMVTYQYVKFYVYHYPFRSYQH